MQKRTVVPEVSKKLAVVPKKGPTEIQTTEQVLVGVGQALTRLANQLGKATEEELPELYATIASYEGVLEAAKDNIKRRALPIVLNKGETVTEKGTKRLQVGGFVVEAQPNRTGYDPKKLESLLRMNGHEPTVAMDQKVTYTVNEGKLTDFVRGAALTADQVEATRYDVTYKFLVKRANEVREESDNE
jgi:hypothetical protein